MQPIHKVRYLLQASLLAATIPQSAQCFYNSPTGKWLSRDPAGEAGGVSLNALAGNNPIGAVDSLGLTPCSACPCAQNPSKCKLMFIWGQWNPTESQLELFRWDPINNYPTTRTFNMREPITVLLYSDDANVDVKGCRLHQSVHSVSTFPNAPTEQHTGNPNDWTISDDYGSNVPDRAYIGWMYWDTPTVVQDLRPARPTTPLAIWWQAHVYVEEAPSVEGWWGFATTAIYDQDPARNRTIKWPPGGQQQQFYPIP